MDIQVNFIDYILNNKLNKLEKTFLFLLSQNKSICLSHLKQFVNLTYNKQLRNKLDVICNNLSIKKVNLSNRVYYELNELSEVKQYIKIDDIEVLNKFTCKELDLYLILAKFSYLDNFYQSREYIEFIFDNISNFNKITKKFTSFKFISKFKYNKIYGYDVINLNKKELTVKKEVKVIDNKTSEIKEFIKQVEIKKELEKEKMELENIEKEKVITSIKDNFDKIEDKFIELIEKNKDTLEYILYSKCKKENTDLFKNHVISSFIYKNKDLLTI